MKDTRRLYIISGTSSGLGEAFARFVLSTEPNCEVVGWSRRSVDLGDRYQHISIDLSAKEEIENIKWPNPEGFNEVIFVSNAATIGEVKPVGFLNMEQIERDVFLNTTGPLMLMNSFYKAYKDAPCEKQILNISSGAAQYAIASWSMYCGSKAALNAFNEVFAQELRSNGVNDTHVFAIAPGILDTEMQATIREKSKEDFPDVERFIQYFENEELVSPEEVAKKLYFVVENANQIAQVTFSLRDMHELAH
jgi:benzil reductase ((S)-benzoin forming)